MARLKLRGIPTIYEIQKIEADAIREIWKDPSKKPDHGISVGPLDFQKKDIQLLESEENLSFKYGVDLSDPVKREEVRQFEREFNNFLKSQSEEKRTFEHFLCHKKIVSFTKPPRIAQSGMERFNQYSMIVHNPQVFKDIYPKYNAMQAMRAYAERSLPNDIQTQKETMFSVEEEINPKDIPF